ncbi:MAG: hypothetical protein J5482_00310 [Oscillospiraceae bacterium]|nr:hypothetical protein [Oscillospiraceae bacterium]
MAKKVYDPNDYAARQAAIRKARGNPNKNVHRKKNGSNYGGVNAVKRDAARQQETKQPPMPRGVRIAQWVLIGVLAVLMILYYAVFPGNLTFSYVCALLLGGTCCFLAYVNRTYRKREGAFFKILTVVLAFLGIVYAIIGLLGLVALLRGQG